MAWTDLLAPQVHLCWTGTWRTGVLEAARWNTDHLLVIVSKGRCRIDIAGDEHELADDRFVIIPPGTRHLSYAVEGPCTRLCLHFDWAWSGDPPEDTLWSFDAKAQPPVRTAPAWLPGGILAGQAAPPAVAAAQRLVARWRAGERTAARGNALELLLALFAPADPPAQSDRVADLAWQVKDRLDEGGLDDRSLRTELRQLGHSYEHLCRCFVRTFGMPPLRYLQLAKIERAKRLLVAGGATVAEVANTLGYRDASHFSRVFRTATGATPSRWKP